MARHIKETGQSDSDSTTRSAAHSRLGSHSRAEGGSEGASTSRSDRAARPHARKHAPGSSHRAHFGASAVTSSASSEAGKGKGPLVFGIVVAVVILIAVGFCASKLVFGDSGFSEEQKLVNEGKTFSVTIPEGASTSDIASILSQSGLIDDTRTFSKCVKSMSATTSLKPGTYEIVCGTSMEDIVSMLEAGPTGISVVIPEGYTLSKTAEAVESASEGRISAADFLSLASNSSAFAKDYPFLSEAGSGTLEGYLFPKTYEIDESSTAESMIRMMLDQFVIETERLDYSYPEKAGLSKYETVVLASIIEREAASENRATVASVFYNRLEEGMCLQSDATVAYVVDRDPTPADLEVDSPYNTYLVKGLPQGPICSPSLASLQAACSPESTDYLYFYFTADGKYSFSKTFDEHQDAIVED